MKKDELVRELLEQCGHITYQCYKYLPPKTTADFILARDRKIMGRVLEPLERKFTKNKEMYDKISNAISICKEYINE